MACTHKQTVGMRNPGVMARVHRVAPLTRPRLATMQRASAREELRRLEDERVTMRAEAEAPFRTLRLVIYGFSAASAGVAALISLPQLAGALGGARGALSVDEVLTNLAVNLGAVGIFGFLLRQDWQAREKQLARLSREAALAAQRVRLANGRRVALRDLQGAARCVLVAGTPAQVAASLAAAEPYRAELERRGVFVVPVPIYDEQQPGTSSSGGGEGVESSISNTSTSSSSGGAAPSAAALPPLTRADLRWRGDAEQLGGYRQWFSDQLKLTPAKKISSDQGLYVGLRLDGRVRASGMGGAPWARFVAELAPLEGDGKWAGAMSGFDGDSAPR